MNLTFAEAGDEQILWQSRPAWRDFFALLMFGVFMLPVFGLGLIILIYVTIERFRCLYLVTEDRVVCKTGILARDVSEVDILDLRDISLHQSFIQKILCTGDVGFSSAGQSGVEVMFKGVSRPERVKEIVRQRKRELQRELFRESGPAVQELDE
jgi:uncharacterized membrane protein YdbT with pleckstrin-like domain